MAAPAVVLWVQVPGEDPALLTDALPAPGASARLLDGPSRVLWRLAGGSLGDFLDACAGLKDPLEKLIETEGAKISLDVAVDSALGVDAATLGRLADLGLPVSFVARVAA
ncbi:hypothetical protein [Hamadaea tsunoensis]|uniref:hypothetical protein n=1 Tax=Hamadaea tsunoensis TaxID=53368 RepID=UPI0003F6933C|nr:hypothetical protein [Hamadaea tsunoensis]